MTALAQRTPTSAPRVRLLLAGALVLGGCGLFGREERIGFRSYPLQDVAYDEAVSIVQTVTRDVCTQLFGGVTLTWSPDDGNLMVDPIHAGNRRLRLYIQVRPAGKDANVEMLALVDHLASGGQEVGYTQLMQDVPLEEKLSQAFVAELLRRREAGP